MPINIDHRQNVIVTNDGLLDFSITGSVKIPAGTTGQRPVSPIAGMIRYNSTLGTFEGYTTTWGAIGGGGGVPTGGGSDEIFWENEQTITTDYTITNNRNAMTAGPVTINTGVTVTVGTGETWRII